MQKESTKMEDAEMEQEDIVHVVRCRDCVHYNEIVPAAPGFSGGGCCEFYGTHGVLEGHFCSLGKRRHERCTEI